MRVREAVMVKEWRDRKHAGMRRRRREKIGERDDERRSFGNPGLNEKEK